MEKVLINKEEYMITLINKETVKLLHSDMFFDIKSQKLYHNNTEISISKEEREILHKFSIKERRISNKFYKKVLNGELVLKLEGTNIYTDELLESSFNPYYIKLLIYGFNKYYKCKVKDFLDLEKRIYMVLKELGTNEIKLNEILCLDNSLYNELKAS